jgi:hypothetical protein
MMIAERLGCISVAVLWQSIPRDHDARRGEEICQNKAKDGSNAESLTAIPAAGHAHAQDGC